MPPKATKPVQTTGARRALSQVDEQVNVCYYGEPGSAKTTSLAAGSRRGPQLFINAESGLKSRPLRQLGMDLDQISVFPDTSTGETISFDELEALAWELKAELQDDPAAYWSVAMDSVTEVQKLLLTDILGDAREKAEAKGKDRGRFDTYQEDWGTNTEQMRELLHLFRDLPCHFAIAALPRRDVDDDGSVKYGPGVTPALQNDIFAFFDILCYTEELEIEGRDEPVYIGRFRKTGTKRAKDRFKALPRVMINPWLDRVVDYVNDDLTEDDDEIQQAGLTLLREGAPKKRRKKTSDESSSEDN